MMHPAKQSTTAARRELPRKERPLADITEPDGGKYFELFDFAPDAYFVTDGQGTIREANLAATKLLGVSSRDLEGTRLTDFFDETARKSYRRQLDQLSKVERIDDWEIVLKPRTGSPVPVSVTLGPIAGKQRKITGYRWMARDITRRKRAEEEALRANRAKAAFIALLSHEFRTPLQAIFGYAELLESEVHGPLNEAQRRDLDRIQQSQRELLALINATLEISRLDAAGTVPDLTTIGRTAVGRTTG